MKKEMLRSLKKGDPALFLFLILFYLMLIFYPYSQKEALNVVIYHNNTRIVKDITKDTSLKIENATVDIEHKRVRVSENDCPGKQCVMTGWISDVGEFILCDYYDILIKIEGKEEKYDAITF